VRRLHGSGQGGHPVWAVLGRGLGIGAGFRRGRVRVATRPRGRRRLVDGEILVVRRTSTADYLSAIRKAKAVIAAGAGSESQRGQVIAQRLGSAGESSVLSATPPPTCAMASS